MKTRSISRRDLLSHFLKIGTVISLPNALQPLRLFANERFNSLLTELTGNPLRFPPVFTNGGTMTLAESTVQVWPGQNTQVLAINGSYPGPSVVIQKGQTFNATFVNNLTEPTTTHWHGLILPELMDGHPKDAVAPGNSYTYTFPVLNRAGTYFYHAHGDMVTAKEVYRGFAGFFIVTDPAENFNLPSGSYDVPLCIQDRRVANQRQFTYNPTMLDTMNGFMGDVPLVNGTPDAYLEVSRTLYRFRLLNGSNARVYKIAFSDNRSFHIIATDGGLKDVPVSATSFFLSPGERVDILVDFSPNVIGENVTLKSLAFAGGGMGTYRQGVEMNLLRFDVTGSASSGGIVPASMTPISHYNPSDVVRTRTFVLTMVMGGTGMHRINNRTFEMNRIDEEVRRNDLEEWRIVNGTDEFHPMHVHGVLFQVLSRNGTTNLPPSDRGWKDTVLVNPSETVRVLIKFTDYTGIYLFHCHNLEHEDDGMMLNFRVNPATAVEENENIPDEFRLHQNYPNPFNPSTTITFDVPEPSSVSVNVYNALGEEVATLVNERMAAGQHKVVFSALGRGGEILPSGFYMARLSARTLLAKPSLREGKAGDASTGSARRFVSTVKMVLAK